MGNISSEVRRTLRKKGNIGIYPDLYISMDCSREIYLYIYHGQIIYTVDYEHYQFQLVDGRTKWARASIAVNLPEGIHLNFEYWAEWANGENTLLKLDD